MAILNTSSVVDIHFKQMLDKDPDRAAACVALAETDMRAAAQVVGVAPDDIPLDEDDYVVSATLQTYGLLRMLMYAMEALMGSVSVGDVYEKKMTRYETRSATARKDITLQTIMLQVETRVASRIGSKPVW